jgi:hypothetical protein
MTVKELHKKLSKYVDKGFGDVELKTSDQGGNDGEVLGVYDYDNPDEDYGKVIEIEVA